jgi:cytochrome c553
MDRKTIVMIKNIIFVLALVSVPALSATAATAAPAVTPTTAVTALTVPDGLDWAYPFPCKPPGSDSIHMFQVPGSEKQYSEAQISDAFNPPDWFPNEHPPMPKVVAQGSKPDVKACALCHLPTGSGHPESADIAAQPAAYTVRQMADFKNGKRVGVRAQVMVVIAKAMTDEDIQAAAAYFASLKQRIWTQVIEAKTVNKSYVGEGCMRFATPDGDKEALGQRIIVLPEDAAQVKVRNPHSGFIAYVPPGSLAKGKALVSSGVAGEEGSRCVACHGSDLKGLNGAPGPGIAGRDAIYTFRQLYGIKTGARVPLEPMMKKIADKLSNDDMIAISAYLASLKP